MSVSNGKIANPDCDFFIFFVGNVISDPKKIIKKWWSGLAILPLLEIYPLFIILLHEFYCLKGMSLDFGRLFFFEQPEHFLGHVDQILAKQLKMVEYSQQ